MNNKIYTVYTDGSCLNSFGGWSFIIIKPDNSIIERFGTVIPSTNNIAELSAIYQALITLKELDEGISYVVLKTDSKYAIEVCSGQSRAKANKDLVADIRTMVIAIPNILFVYESDANGTMIRRCHNNAVLQAELASSSTEGYIVVSKADVSFVYEEVKHLTSFTQVKEVLKKMLSYET